MDIDDTTRTCRSDFFLYFELAVLLIEGLFRGTGGRDPKGVKEIQERGGHPEHAASIATAGLGTGQLQAHLFIYTSVRQGTSY